MKDEQAMSDTDEEEESKLLKEDNEKTTQALKRK
jgi:hypothetical protein